MKLGQLFGSEVYTGQTDTGAQVQSAHAAEFIRQINSLIPGQTIQGEILSIVENDVRILLEENNIIQAKVDAGVHLEEGQHVTFEVKNNGNTLSLSPLFTNVASDVNVLKAIDMAGLPVNQDSVMMTEQLMKAGLPVNRSMLQQVYREIRAFPQNVVSDVVNLHKLNLTVNETNMQQMSAYRNLEHQIVEGIHTILDRLPEAINQVVTSEDMSLTLSFYRDLMKLSNEPIPDNSVPGECPKDVIKLGELPIDMTTSGEMNKDAIALGEITSDTGHQGIISHNNLLTEVRQQVISFLDTLSVTEEEKSIMKQEIMQQSDIESFDAIKQLFTRKSFQTKLLSALKQQWTIAPEDVSKPKRMENLYKHLERQLRELENILENSGNKDTGVYKAVSNMSGNIDFMQQINQTYAYIQLPLKLQESDAHGELYVYTNKKNLAQKDGEISALLHLDMQHLGPLDVYVKLSDIKVSTKFYVENEDILDLIENHMDMLTVRLAKKGYDCKLTATMRADDDKAETTGLQPLVESDKEMILTTYAFDMRA